MTSAFFSELWKKNEENGKMKFLLVEGSKSNFVVYLIQTIHMPFEITLGINIVRFKCFGYYTGHTIVIYYIFIRW